MGQVIPMDMAAMHQAMVDMQAQMHALQQESQAMRQGAHDQLEREARLLAEVQVMRVYHGVRAQSEREFNRRLSVVERRQFDPLVVGGSVVKVTLKSSAVVIKVATKTATEAAKVFGKWVPGLSLVLGIALAIQRYRKGEHWGYVVAEVVSGAVACIPLYGTAASLSIDAVMLGVEIGLKMRKPGAAPQQTPEEKLAIAHKTLDVVGQEPDRAVFHRQYQRLVVAVHPDLLIGEGEAVGEVAHEMTQVLNEAWETVRTHYQWV